MQDFDAIFITLIFLIPFRLIEIKLSGFSFNLLENTLTFHRFKSVKSRRQKPVLNCDEPLIILKVRYAKGEISKAKFNEMKEDLK